MFVCDIEFFKDSITFIISFLGYHSTYHCQLWDLFPYQTYISIIVIKLNMSVYVYLWHIPPSTKRLIFSLQQKQFIFQSFFIFTCLAIDNKKTCNIIYKLNSILKIIYHSFRIDYVLLLCRGVLTTSFFSPVSDNKLYCNFYNQNPYIYWFFSSPCP